MTTRLNPPPGAAFTQVLMGEATQAIILATNASYGFLSTLGDLEAGNKNGKAVVTVPEGAAVMPVQIVTNPEEDWLVVLSSEGRLLMYPVKDLPMLSKGKGNKLLGLDEGEVLKAMIVCRTGDKVVVHTSNRHLTLKWSDLEHYRGERGRRGAKLPRGFQRVESLSPGA